MSVENLVVADTMVVAMEYELRLDEGQVISHAGKDEPLEYIHGAGQILPGLEKELNGMAVGDEKEVSVEPSEGYGDRKPEEIMEVAREKFPSDFELIIGNPISVKNPETKRNYTAYIAEVRPETVMLDFNHPLAGKTLHFKIKIASLRNASQEELMHGHVHGDEHAD